MFMVDISNWLVDTTMEHVPSTDDLATRNGDIPVRKPLVYQRPTTFFAQIMKISKMDQSGYSNMYGC